MVGAAVSFAEFGLGDVGMGSAESYAMRRRSVRYMVRSSRHPKPMSPNGERAGISRSATASASKDPGSVKVYLSVGPTTPGIRMLIVAVSVMKSIVPLASRTPPLVTTPVSIEPPTNVLCEAVAVTPPIATTLLTSLTSDRFRFALEC